jgi:hypothetical protein
LNLYIGGKADRKGKGKKMNIKLTDKQADALAWAITLTEASFDGWTKEEMGKEVVSDLAALKRVFNKLSEGAYRPEEVNA